MHKGFLKTAFIFAATAVILGAFGAHGLKKIISESSLVTFETGVRYQFYHSFALMITGLVYKDLLHKWCDYAFKLFTSGIFLFSGSLYLLAILGVQYRFLGAITPLGGVCFIIGWLMLFRASAEKKNSA